MNLQLSDLLDRVAAALRLPPHPQDAALERVSAEYGFEATTWMLGIVLTWPERAWKEHLDA